MNTNIDSTNSIQTRQDFVKFLNELLEDYQTNKSAWGNKDLESFLEALSRYAEDMNGLYKNTNQTSMPTILRGKYSLTC